MGTLLRMLVIVGVLLLAYGVFIQTRQPAPPGIRGVLQRIGALLRQARLVALIYVLVLVISAWGPSVLRVLRGYFGWGV